jgi:hypothetical protein
MRRRLSHRSALPDLIAFVTVLATGVTFVALGLSPEAMAAVTVSLMGLYSVWRKGRSGDDSRGGPGTHQDAPDPETCPEGEAKHSARERSADGT